MPVLSGIDLDQTLGALFIGHFVASLLYGLTSLQTYTYYGRSSNDSSFLKWLVALLWVLDSLQMTFISHTFYTYAVSHFGDLEALGKITWSIVTQIIVTCLSDAIVRGIFCYRIWILSDRNRVFLAANVICTTAMAVCHLALAIKCYSFTYYSELTEISWLFYLSISSCFTADLTIALILSWLLSTRRTRFNQVDNIIRTLIMYSINTAALTAVGTLLCLITFAVSPRTFIFIAFYFVLAKLLLNSLLAGLNSRRALRDQIRLLGGTSSSGCGQLSSYASMGGNRIMDPSQVAELPAPPRNVYPARNHKGLTVAV